MVTSIKDWWNGAVQSCLYHFPRVSDPARRSALLLIVASVGLHLIYSGVLFLLDGHLIKRTKDEPWYTALYLLLFIAALGQYFFTAGSSPGFVPDAIRVSDESDALFKRFNQEQRQSASSKNEHSESNTPSWAKLLMSMYPPGSSIGTWTCPFCNVI